MRGKFRCTYCGKTYIEPLTHIYEYEGIDRIHTSYPRTEIKFCVDCQDFVCIQKGISVLKLIDEIKHESPDRAKYLHGLLYMLNGRNTKDACVRCGGSNLKDRYLCFCPDCGIGSFEYVEPGESLDIRIRYSKKTIKPIFADVDVKNTVSNNDYASKKDDYSKADQKKNKVINDENSNTIIKLIAKIAKNILIVVFILALSSLIKNGEIQMPPLSDGYPSIAYLLYLIPLFGLAFLYPFTKYGAMIFLGFVIPKKYKGDISDTTLMFLAHIITIVIWIMVASGIISPEYSGPNSRAEHYLGL